MIKQQLLKLTNNRVASYILSGLERTTSGEAEGLRVLTYHRVAEPGEWPHLSPSILSATPGDFTAQMRYVAQAYTPVSAQMVLDHFEHGARLPARAILITFDDAYRDFADHAWSVLKAAGVPVVLFVPTAYPDHPERSLWWDRLYDALQRTQVQSVVVRGMSLPMETPRAKMQTYRRLREYVKSLPHTEAMPFIDTVCEQMGVAAHGDNGILGWNEIKRLAAEGVTIGAHTRTHPLLTRVSEDEAVAEVLGSFDDLRQQVMHVPPVFAYPSGAASPALAERLREAGVRLAFTTERGINRLHSSDPLLLKRINVSRNTTVNLLRAQLLSLRTSAYDGGASPRQVGNEA